MEKKKWKGFSIRNAGMFTWPHSAQRTAHSASRELTLFSLHVGAALVGLGTHLSH